MDRRLSVAEFFTYLHEHEATAALAESLSAIWLSRISRLRPAPIPLDRDRAAS